MDPKLQDFYVESGIEIKNLEDFEAKICGLEVLQKERRGHPNAYVCLKGPHYRLFET